LRVGAIGVGNMGAPDGGAAVASLRILEPMPARARVPATDSGVRLRRALPAAARAPT